MRLRGKAAASWGTLLALSIPLWTTVLAKTETPNIKTTEFPFPPVNLNYFEDSDSIVFHDISNGEIYRSKDGGVSWDKVKDIARGTAYRLIMHGFDPHRAYVLTEGLEHWKTHDRGETWTKWRSGVEVSAFRGDLLHFHAGDPDRIIFNGMDCASIFCDEISTYTTDGFQTPAKLLRGGTAGCWWAKASKLFATGQADLDANRVLCIGRDSFSPFREDQRLFVSDSFFQVKDDQIQEFEPNMDTDHGVQGVIGLTVVKKHLLVAIASLNTAEMALFVTDDTLKWHRAMFPMAHGHKVHEDAYTVLESTNYSIQIDVMTTRPSNPMGIMFTSNSNGTYFTENKEHTNQNSMGHVDFEKIAGIQGIFLLNSVTNWEEVERSPGAKKSIVTQITFDDGRTFEDLKAGDDTIHLHSVTDADNVGRVYSSLAPGLVMGVGNTGKSLKDFRDCDTYVSDDAGRNWKKALDGPHKYEFGDQGSILVAVHDSGKADVGEIKYSLDHGDSWEKVPLPGDLQVRPAFLTTTQDSTSLKFLMVGQTGSENDSKFQVIAIDFEGLHERTCGDGDLEDWPARVGDDGKPTCIMGHKQTFTRRKKKADCFIKQAFKEPVPKSEVCECTDMDFECDYNFIKKNGECVQAGPVVDPEGTCKNAQPTDMFKGSSGWRLIPGNTCQRKGGEQKDATKDRPCSDSINPPSGPTSGEIEMTVHEFKAAPHFKEFEKFYLERGDSSSDNDETVLVRPVVHQADGMLVENKIWRTTDHGKKWDRILEDENIRGILPHQYFKDFVFFTTDTEKVLYTIDRGKTFHHFEAPTRAQQNVPLSFHPDKKDWLIWLGEKCEEGQCYLEASLSTDRGDRWETIVRYASKCEFTGHSAYKQYHERDLKQIICTAHERESNEPDNPKQIVVSNDFFKEDTRRYLTNVRDFATMAEFIVIAAEEKGKEGLQALTSLDGAEFAEARFPYNFKAGHQNAYTVLDSSTHSINLFVATETTEGRRYGTIVKSNSNGTSYVLSASGVNCNDKYYVDFEKIPGLEGLTLVNTVANQDAKNEPKRLQTKITHNDGAEWTFLPPPAADIEGKPYECSSRNGDEKCALHLHHYTERDDTKRTFSAATAVGLMFGVGNVGPNLGSTKDADTFMTTDAGITWKNVKKGAWTWQYGDQGSLTVLVQRYTDDHKVKTKMVSFSTDEGNKWEDYTFWDEEVMVLDITALRSGSSRNFLLWCVDNSGGLFSVNLDFTGRISRPCKAVPEDPAKSDYYMWSPKHPGHSSDDECLFGHVSQYIRKKPAADCYSDQRIQHQYMVKNCTCERSDFECAYNFELDNSGQCKLVDDLQPMSMEQWCKENPEASTYYAATGYRRVPMTTCVNGLQMDISQQATACPGHEEEFEREHRVSGVAIFFAVVIPIGFAAAIGWWVWRNWSGKFGQIRLGEQPGLNTDAPWVRYPVIAVSAVVAVAASIPLMVSALWRMATSAYERVGGGSFVGGGGRSWLSTQGPRRFTTRDSFARGGDYAVVDEDEGELLGEDSDEEV